MYKNPLLSFSIFSQIAPEKQYKNLLNKSIFNYEIQQFLTIIGIALFNRYLKHKMTFRDRRGTLILEGSDTNFKDKLLFFEGVNLVGRNPAKTNVTIKDRSISEIHAKILCRDRTIKIVDAKSKNGVYLNNLQNPIEPDTQIQINPKIDIVFFAQIKCRFQPDWIEKQNEEETKQFTIKTFKPNTKANQVAQQKDVKLRQTQKVQINQNKNLKKDVETKEKNEKNQDSLKANNNKQTKKQQLNNKDKQKQKEELLKAILAEQQDKKKEEKYNQKENNETDIDQKLKNNKNLQNQQKQQIKEIKKKGKKQSKQKGSKNVDAKKNSKQEQKQEVKQQKVSLPKQKQENKSKQKQEQKQKEKQKAKTKQRQKEKQKQKQKQKDKAESKKQKNKQSKKSLKQQKDMKSEKSVDTKQKQLKQMEKKIEKQIKQEKQKLAKKQKRGDSNQTKVKPKNKRLIKSVEKNAQKQQNKKFLNQKSIPEQLNSSFSSHPKRPIITKKVLLSSFKPAFTPFSRITIVQNWRQQFDVLVMQKFTRTFKLLYAICLGIPVVSYNWMIQCQYRRGIASFERFYLQCPQKDLIQNVLKKVKSGFKVFNKLKFYLIQSDSGYHLPIQQIQTLIQIGGGIIIKKLNKKDDIKQILFIMKLQYGDQDIKSLKKIDGAQKIYNIQMILDSCLHQEIKWSQNTVSKL